MRRFGIQRDLRQTQTLLPLHTSSSNNLSKTVSCWYCDIKISSLNKPLFYFGRRHARCMKVWFSIGVGFALSALLGVTVILLWESARALHLCCVNNRLGNVMRDLLFGFSPVLSGFSLSPADAGYICISTIISVSVHEFGHAAAAASEGIQIEYIAIFIAVLFPGALVAFNYELLQALPNLTALRVYSAGIWHNAVCCAGCGLALLLLPLILFPFYMHGHNAMVLDVPPASPLYGYLAPGDVILSVDDVPIRNSHEWIVVNSLKNHIKLNNVNISQHTGESGAVNGRYGYCVPTFVMEKSENAELVENHYVCPNDLNAFVKFICSTTTLESLDDDQSEVEYLNSGWTINCLNAKDVVKLNKCGAGWGVPLTNGKRGCTCSEDQSCFSPVLEPGLGWVEITYSNPFSNECSLLGRNRFPISEASDSKDTNCGRTFIFVGDVISMAHSIQLTSYQPRGALKFIACFPNVLERILIWTFHVSLALALLNSLPVYFLDGGSILDVILSHFTLLSSRKREKLVRLCLIAGSIISIMVFIQELL